MKPKTRRERIVEILERNFDFEKHFYQEALSKATQEIEDMFLSEEEIAGIIFLNIKGVMVNGVDNLKLAKAIIQAQADKGEDE